ncbi:hypothetical protein Bca101_071967 [Brassica carinata]
MAGRWIMFDNGAWDFKIDNDRMGRAVDSSRIRGAEELKTCIVAAYGLLGREVLAEMSYWLNDGESEMVGLVASPVEIAMDKDFRIFKALHRADKSVNLFVILRESVGGEMIFLRSERVIRVQMNAPVRPPDEDVAFLMEVQQIEERYKRNSQSGGMVATSKDQDKSGETLDDGSGANPENCEQEKGNVCGDDLAVDNRENKEGKVEEGEGPGKGRSGGQSGGKGIRRPGGIGGTGAAKSACETEVGVDVVLVTPPQSKNKHTRVTEDNDDDAVVDTPIPQPAAFQGEEVLTKAGDNVSGTPTDVGCAPNQATEAIESGDICLETPPKQYNTHNRELEDEDDVDPPVTATRQVQGGEAFMKGIQVPDMYGYNDVDGVYNEMDGSSCNPLDIDFSKEDSDIYVGRAFKHKAECKLTLAIYAIAKVCTFKLRHCKRRLTAKCYEKECKWRVVSVQLGDSPTYLVKKAILNHLCIADVRRKYKKHGTAKVLAALLRSKYERLYSGPRLSASGQDANSRVFPIAFAVVESENTKSWTWFFERLSTIVEDGSDLSIISDRCAEIYAAKDKWYPRAHHGICLVHLQRNVNDKFKGLQQKAMVGRAGDAFRVSEFKEIMELIKLTDWRCWDYLKKIDKKLWTRSHFEGGRFNVMTSNAAESLNNALLPARDSPIMALFEFIRRKLCTWYVSRRTEISKMKGNVPDNIQKILVEQLVLSTGLLVMPCSTWLFEVTHRPTNFGFTVDLDKRTCTCLEFQKLGLPCRHAIAAASCRNMQYTMFVCKHHLKETWAETVRGIILTVPDPKDVEVPAEILTVDLYPPTTKRTKGRP